MRNIFYVIPAIILALSLGGCTGDEVKVSGRFVANDNRMVYLEQLAGKSHNITDSVATDDDGNFSFNVKLPDGEPAIYFLLCRNDRIALLLSPGDRVKLHSIGNVSRTYTVEGSEGSARMKDFNDMMRRNKARLDSVLNIYANTPEPDRQEVAKEYTEAYYSAKRDQITFIVTDPGSLASLYALYQRVLPTDAYLSDQNNDVVYYRQVADSVSAKYPESPYVKALRNDISKMEREQEVIDMFNESISSGGEGYPDIDIPDMYGKRQRLSSLQGNVILVDFWSAAVADNRLLNAELKEVYDRFSGEEFSIYQVSIDDDKLVWINAVQEQKLPWITVWDNKGSGQRAAVSYNVQSLPANFLIDKNGTLVAKNLYGGELTRTIEQLLKQ